MSENLPLHASHEVSQKIAKRVEASLKEALATCGYAWPDLSELERKREVAYASVRQGHRWLDEVAGIPELEPDEFDAELATGTPTGGTPAVNP